MDSADALQIKQAIIKTLVYRDLFDYPLTAEEIHRLLIQRKCSREVVEKTLKEAITGGEIYVEDSYYFLPGREKTVLLRKRREDISQAKFKKTIACVRFLRPIPWVRGIFITGALAVGNAEVGSDLDILIIASERRVWLTRLLSTLLFDLLRVRIKAPHKVKDRICPNIFLAETALQVPEDEQNLYTAHEVIQARPIWERDRIHSRFLAENDWVRKFLPNANLLHKASEPRLGRGFPFFDWLESLVYKLQLKYMEKKRTREVVTPERILFHPTNLAAEILSKFEERLKQRGVPISSALDNSR